jgi:hypothetical protein
MSYIDEGIMETFNLSSILLFALITGIGIYFLIKLISKSQNAKAKPTNNNIAQDFSAFDSSSDKFKSSVEENAEQNIEEKNESNLEEYTIKGDIYKLEEFLGMLTTIPDDSFDDIQISLGEPDDLFISVEKDAKKGIVADVFFAEDLNISYDKWAPQIKNIIWEYRLESEETVEDRDKYFSICLGDKSLSTFAEFIKKIIQAGYSEYAGKNLLIEFNHY